MRKTKTTKRAGVHKPVPSTGSTAARRRVARTTQSARQPKPKTAYDLLNRVCAHILKEPRRYDQETWVYRDKKVIKRVMGSVPSCGAMACRAGWIVALHDGLDSPMMHNHRIADRAHQILGMSDRETGAVFGACDVHYADPANPPKHGTRRYAREGVRGLRAFMKAYAAHLKARQLADVPPSEQ